MLVLLNGGNVSGIYTTESSSAYSQTVFIDQQIPYVSALAVDSLTVKGYAGSNSNSKNLKGCTTFSYQVIEFY